MQNKEFNIFKDKLILAYYQLLKEKGFKDNYDNFHLKMNELIFDLFIMYTKLHSFSMNIDAGDSNIMASISEIGIGDDIYQVQLCAIKDKENWINNDVDIRLSNLIKVEVMDIKK
jgi:hypothetical protein